MKLNADFNGVLIQNELHNVGPSEFALEHDTIMDDGFAIYTGVNQTGEELVLGTDYELLDEDTRLSTQTDGKHIYTKVRVLNEDYQGINLYITYKTVGDYAVAEDINAAIEKIRTPQLKVDLTNPEMVPTWPFIMNHTKNHEIWLPSGEVCAACCDDKYVYVGISPSSIIKIDAYTKVQVLRVDTDQFSTYRPTYMFNLGNYLFVTNLAGEIIKYDTDTLTEVGRSQSYRYMEGLTADYDYLYCLLDDPSKLKLAIIDPNTMNEIQSIDINERRHHDIIVVENKTPLIVCGRDGLVFRGRELGSSGSRLIWISRTSPRWNEVSDFSADIYPTGTIFTQAGTIFNQDDSFFSIKQYQSSNVSTIERVRANYKTGMLTFSTNNGFENIKATTDGKYVYFVGNSNDLLSALIVIKYDPIANKATKKTIQGTPPPKAVTSNGRQLIILCEYSSLVKLLFLNDRLEEEVEP